MRCRRRRACHRRYRRAAPRRTLLAIVEWCARAEGFRSVRTRPCTTHGEVAGDEIVIAARSLVLEVGDDDRPEVAAHFKGCFFPSSRNKPGWVSSSIARSTNDAPMSVSSVSSGHFGSGNAPGSATSILYSSFPRAFRLVSCVQNSFADLQPFKLNSFQVLSRLMVGTCARKKTSYGFVASTRACRRIFPAANT